MLYPAPPTAFSSYTDAVERLLPYHIYQIHDSELEGQERNVAAEARRERRGESVLIDLPFLAYHVLDRVFGIEPSSSWLAFLSVPLLDYNGPSLRFITACMSGSSALSPNSSLFHR